MKFVLFAAAFAALSLAAPTPLDKRAVFKTTTYDALSISGGVAGNGEQEALDVLAGLPTDLAKVEKADLDFLNSVNQIANKAEVQAFNPAIEEATGTALTGLENGKRKNKILKLTATVLKLQAQQAQGQDVAEKLAAEQKKLDKNIAADVAAAGQTSTALNFDATTS
ncbi:hypothetical protein GE09DRAFT_491976 [Coniochaeta sp. 2T2.1]|nr:hypothetical protein GE09DRAFT_491976 [Coniochaeta sp. 2T2.1]